MTVLVVASTLALAAFWVVILTTNSEVGDWRCWCLKVKIQIVGFIELRGILL